MKRDDASPLTAEEKRKLRQLARQLVQEQSQVAENDPDALARGWTTNDLYEARGFLREAALEEENDAAHADLRRPLEAVELVGLRLFLAMHSEAGAELPQGPMSLSYYPASCRRLLADFTPEIWEQVALRVKSDYGTKLEAICRQLIVAIDPELTPDQATAAAIRTVKNLTTPELNAALTGILAVKDVDGTIWRHRPDGL